MHPQQRRHRCTCNRKTVASDPIILRSPPPVSNCHLCDNAQCQPATDIKCYRCRRCDPQLQLWWRGATHTSTCLNHICSLKNTRAPNTEHFFHVHHAVSMQLLADPQLTSNPEACEEQSATETARNHVVEPSGSCHTAANSTFPPQDTSRCP